MAIPAVEIAIRTDPGRDPDKQVNEDAAVHVETPLGLLAVVCDGMGGHAGGREASHLAIDTIVEIVKSAPTTTSPRDALRVAIEEANRRIWSMVTAESGLRPGSTVVAILAHEGGADVAHVGDSRVYLVHAGVVSQVTRDHSMVQEMVDRNLIRAEDAANHPDANKILRALGIAKEVEVDVRAEPVQYVAGDVFVLCSDGLSDLVGAGEILEVAGARPPLQAAAQFVDMANARGGHDNITALVVRFKTSANPRDAATIVKTMQLTAHDSGRALAGDGPSGTVLSPPVQGGPMLTVPSPAHAPPPVTPSTPNLAAMGTSTPGMAPVPIPPPPASASRPSKLPLILGVILGLVALVIVGALALVVMRPKHRRVPLEAGALDPAGSTSSTSAVADDDDGGDTALPATPPLVPVVDAGRHHHHHHRRDGGGAADASDVPPLPPAVPTVTPRAPSGAVTPPPPVPPPPVPPLPPPNGGTVRGTAEPPVCATARAAKARGSKPEVVAPLEAQCRAAGGVP